MNAVDLDDTTNCPLGHRCESCGAAGNGVTVQTATTPLGVLCLTMCPRCSRSTVAPPLAVGTVVRLVMQHCEQLGIDADEMAAAMDERPVGDR